MTKRIIWKCRKKQILVSWKSSGPLWLKSEQRLCNKITEDDIRWRKMMSISNVYLPLVITHISPPQYKISDVKARLALIFGSLHQVVKTIKNHCVDNCNHPPSLFTLHGIEVFCQGRSRSGDVRRDFQHCNIDYIWVTTSKTAPHKTIICVSFLHLVIHASC